MHEEANEEAAAADSHSGGSEQTKKQPLKCVWPRAALDVLTSLASRAAEQKAKRRATLSGMLAELEALVDMDTDAQVEAPAITPRRRRRPRRSRASRLQLVV